MTAGLSSLNLLAISDSKLKEQSLKRVDYTRRRRDVKRRIKKILIELEFQLDFFSLKIESGLLALDFKDRSAFLKFFSNAHDLIIDERKATIS